MATLSGADPYAQFAEPAVPPGTMAPKRPEQSADLYAQYAEPVETESRGIGRFASPQKLTQPAPPSIGELVKGVIGLGTHPGTVEQRPLENELGADNALYRRTKQRFVEQFDRPVPQDYDVVERASLFPVATYGNGQTGIAWPGIATDIVKGAGSGLVKGVIGLGTLPGTVEQLGRAGMNYASRQLGGPADLVSSSPIFPTYAEGKGGVEKYITGPLYDPKTLPGQYASAVGEFAPGIMFPAAGATSLVGRALTNVVGPAIASETAGQLTKSTQAEPYARVAGALVGGQLPQTVGRMVSPNRIDPTRAQMGAILDAEGVPLTAGDRTGSKAVRWMESNAVDTPFSGHRAQAVKEQQAERFTQAALRRAGINAPRATPEVLDQAFTRIGQDFDNVSQALRVPVTRQLAQQAQDVARRYERITEPTLQNPLVRQLADDLAAAATPPAGIPVAGNVMLGDVYRGWRSDLGAAARGAGVRDHRTEHAVYELQRLLDNAAEGYLRGTNPQLADTWRRARTEYRNILAIERAATSAGENAALGLISPSALRNATITMHGRRNYARGDGDFAELARAGEALLKPLPQSGTNPRAMASAGGMALGSALFGIPGAALGALAPMAGQALLGRATMSPLMQRYLQNQAAEHLLALPAGNRLSAVPGATAQFEEARNPLREVDVATGEITPYQGR